MTRRAVLLMTDRFPREALLARVREIEALGFESLWLPETFGREPIATAGYLLARTERLVVATGIANVYARDATAAAQARRSLAELSDGRFLLGLGVSNVQLNALRGHAWQPPIPKMSAYLDRLEAADVQSPAPDRPAPVHLAAHGPKLQLLAARRANGVITFLMPLQHASETRARIGPSLELSAVVPFIAERDPAVARARARAGLKLYVQLDYYRREWRGLGFVDADFADGGSDRLIDALVAWGDARALNERVAALERAGATRVIVNPFEPSEGSGTASHVLELLAPGG
jgi:probable F420-dependent oxidoreductase